MLLPRVAYDGLRVFKFGAWVGAWVGARGGVAAFFIPTDAARATFDL